MTSSEAEGVAMSIKSIKITASRPSLPSGAEAIEKYLDDRRAEAEREIRPQVEAEIRRELKARTERSA